MRQIGTGSLYDQMDEHGTPEKTYDYFPTNLLQDVVSDGGTSSMTWDADSNRVSFTNADEDTWQFVYDITAGIPAVIKEVSSTSNPIWYIREPDGSLLAKIGPTGGDERFYHFDALGSTRILTDSDGGVSDSYSYDAWGNVTHTGDTNQPYEYVGQLTASLLLAKGFVQRFSDRGFLTFS